MDNLLPLIAVGLVGTFAGWVAASILERSRSLGRQMQLESEFRTLEEFHKEARSDLETARLDLEQVRTSLSAEREGRVRAETRLEEMRTALEEQKVLLATATNRLTDTFNALSSNALKSNNESFIALATQTFDKLLADSRGDLTRRQEAIAGLVKPIQEGLARYENSVREMEKARSEAYGSLRRHLIELNEAQQVLQKETRNLGHALKTPQVTGRWGEITLRRVVELAGLADHCDFYEQASGHAPVEGRLRPDMVVRLPGERVILIDSKVPLQAYLSASDPALDEVRRKEGMKRHAQSVRAHMQQLAAKQYWSQFKPSPEFVVLFLPAESIYSAALQQDPLLIEDGVKNGVIIGTPTTLISLLRAVAYGWQQATMAENARRIAEAGTDLYDRIRSFTIHMDRIRDGLDKAVHAYNRAVGSYETRLLPGARKLRELGAASGQGEVAPPKAVETVMRALPAEEEPDSREDGGSLKR